MEHFVIIVNGWKQLTIITRSSILDVAAVLDPPMKIISYCLQGAYSNFTSFGTIFEIKIMSSCMQKAHSNFTSSDKIFKIPIEAKSRQLQPALQMIG